MIKLSSLINENIDSKVMALKNKLESMGIMTGLRYDPRGYLRPGHIVVPKSEQGKGKGSKAMKLLTDFSDEHNIPILIEPSDELGGDLKRLYSFYSKFGFQKQKSGNKMFRLPKKGKR